MPHDRPPRLLIIGGGFAGLWATRALAGANLRITLIDRRNHHLFQPLLYQVATAGLSAPDIAAPLRHILGCQRNVEVRLGEVEAIDKQHRQVRLRDGGTLDYDLLLANVCKQNVTRFPYEIVRLAEDIAGGLMVTAPSEKDLRDEKIGPYIDKYLRGVATVTTENRMKILRLIENLALGTAAVGYRTESMHGAGSPQAQRIMISRQGNLNAKKELAKAIAHIEE